jgi:hypothetical protein
VGLWERLPLKFHTRRLAAPHRRKASTADGEEAFDSGEAPRNNRIGFLKRLFAR